MSLATKVVDWINPVVLRESRQLTRGRFAVGILMAFLLLMVISAALYVLNIGDSTRNMFSHGKNLFQILYVVLGYACILFIPAYTALPLLLQKQSTSMDLLMVSTIPPRSIIWGKMASAFWMMTLMFSVSMPFMVLTVLLRGIGLFEVIYYLLILAALVQMATIGFVLLACLPVNRVLASILSIGYVLYLIMVPVALTSFTRIGMKGETVLIFLGIAAVVLPIGGALATAFISPAISNRSVGVRVTATSCWMISGIICAFLNTDALQTWAITSSVIAAVSFIPISSEPTLMSRRVQRAIPRNRGLRLLAFPWFTGALNGWLWAAGIILISTLLFGDEREPLCVFALYALSYSLLAVRVRHLPLIRRLPEKHTWTLVITLVLIGTLLPIIAHFIALPNAKPGLQWELGNPFMAFDHSNEHLPFTLISTLVLVLLNGRWILRQCANFHPPQIAEPESEEA